jgi:formylmethanofuran dehydrogenase subunit E
MCLVRGTNSIAVLLAVFLLASSQSMAADGEADNKPDWFYPGWAAAAHYNQPISVRDTDSALGRYSVKTKEIGLKDLARMHGHLCDGLVTSFVQIKAVLHKLFPTGIIDRTDLRVVSRNSPCLVDAAMFMTGARINFRTLRIDSSIGAGFIIQKISTGEAYDVRLRPGIFPEAQAVLENKIRAIRATGQPIAASDIDQFERLADGLSRRVLNATPAEIVEVRRIENYTFVPSDTFGERGDVINKNMPR